MLNFYYQNFILIIPFFFILFNIWVFFLKNNFLIYKYNINSQDILKSSKYNKKIHFIFFLNWVTPFFLFLLIFFIFLKIDFNFFWFNHFKINNFNLNIIIFLFFLNFFLINILKKFNHKNINYNIDYYFSIINIIIFLIFLFLTSNIFTLLFVLEVNSLIFFYKFSVSKFYFKKNFVNKKNNNLFNFFLPKHFLNLIFFQYWINFFSSILLMFFIFNIIYLYGSSEWFLINFLNINFLNKNLIILYVVFVLGFFLKIGLTPNHLFKIEVYKGLPIISIFFYTVFYFFTFFLFFVFVIYYNLNNFNYYIWFLFILFILLGSLYTIFLIFDVNFFKSFLAYSTVLNSIVFFFLFVSYF